MHKPPDWKMKGLFTALIIYISFLLLMKALSKEEFYQESMAKVSQNFIRESETIVQKQIPYNNITNENLDHWDVLFYNQIRKDLY